MSPFKFARSPRTDPPGDPDDLVSAGARERIALKLREIQRKSKMTCDKRQARSGGHAYGERDEVGYQVAVALVRQALGRYGDSGKTPLKKNSDQELRWKLYTMKSFADELFSHLGVGHGCGNGVLVLVERFDIEPFSDFLAK